MRSEVRRWRVLVSAPYAMSSIDVYREQLEAAGCEVVVASVRERLTEEGLLPLVSDIDGLICGDDQITESVMNAAPRLKVISKWGTGIDSIDLDAASQHGIPVYNTPNAFSEPVADTVMGYILLLARQLNLMNREVRSGFWRKPQLVSLRERTLGIVGVGNCGKAVVRRAKAFGIRMLGNDVVRIADEFVTKTGIQMVSLETLLKESDFVSLNPALNSTSFHLINDSKLALMKPTAYLINTSRGSVVDEKALVQALEREQIAGAALDVFEIEPLPEGSPLRQLDNCWLAPHNANSSPVAAQHVHENTIRNLLEELSSHD